MTVLIETAPHKFSANYFFNEWGLFPYFAANKQVKRGGDSQRRTFRYDGEEWDVKLYYQESGLQHPGETTPEGTAFQIETLREFRFKIQSRDDELGQRSFNAHLAPRWPGMKSKGGGEVPVPEGFGEEINVRVDGSNIEFKEDLPLPQRAAEAVDIRRDYFAEPHPYSNVRDAERYVRLDEEVSFRSVPKGT